MQGGDNPTVYPERPSMLLNTLMGDISPGAPEVEISGLAYSSQSVTPGTLFFACPAFGPTATISPPMRSSAERSRSCASAGSGWECRSWSSTTSARRWDPLRRASTGIRPRSSKWSASPARTARPPPPSWSATCSRRAAASCGLLGTVKRVIGGVEEEVERTTPEAIDLQATFRRMLDAGDRACAMEVSSHALELGRAAGIRFACRIFTNLTQDHLDFHETMEAYFAAKRRMFGGAGASVVNVDDEYGRRIAARGGQRDLRDRPRCRLSRPRGGVRPDGLALSLPDPRRRARAALAAGRAVQRAERAGRRRRGALARRPGGGDRGGAAAVRPRAGALRGRRRGTGLRRARRLRAHARLARERAARGARGHARAPARRLRRGRRPRPRQAPRDGRRGAASWPTACS